MTQYRFILEPYKGLNTRYNCPSCGKVKKFVRYLDTETGCHLDKSVGKCNRETKCGYHYSPKQYYHDNLHLIENFNTQQRRIPIKSKQKETSFIPYNLFEDSLKMYGENNFIKYLNSVLGNDVTKQLIHKYQIGTSKYWKGSTVFWQIDNSKNIRTGKIMLYNFNTGKRVKEPFSHITWVHSALQLKNYNLNQCFFGEHLISMEPLKPIALVESEKTAVIASVFLPEFVWLASGSLNNISIEKCNVLQGRNVVLFPDLNCFDKWKEKAILLSKTINCKISNLLELNASLKERENGLDIADYMIKEFQIA